MISRYSQVLRQTHFLLIPGPLDMTANSVLPKRPLLSSLVQRLKAKVPKVHLGTNPCRIKFFGQEIIVLREDLMAKMLRNLVGVKPDVHGEELKRFVRFHSCVFVYTLLIWLQLVQSILDQSHLLPFTQSIQPTLSDYDHAFRLYPLPTAVRVGMCLTVDSTDVDRWRWSWRINMTDTIWPMRAATYSTLVGLLVISFNSQAIFQHNGSLSHGKTWNIPA